MTRYYRLLLGFIWVACLEHFVFQAVAAAAWRPAGSFSLRFNQISDLGNTVCGPYRGNPVCSPQHSLMNASFFALGVLMVVGALLSLRLYAERRVRFGFMLVLAAGLGSCLVGLFPENVGHIGHTSGAILHFVAGNLALVVLASSVPALPRLVRWLGQFFGTVGLLGIILTGSHHYLGLGSGGLERLIAYPISIWLALMGLVLITATGNSSQRVV